MAVYDKSYFQPIAPTAPPPLITATRKNEMNTVETQSVNPGAPPITGGEWRLAQCLAIPAVENDPSAVGKDFAIYYPVITWRTAPVGKVGFCAMPSVL